MRVKENQIRKIVQLLVKESLKESTGRMGRDPSDNLDALVMIHKNKSDEEILEIFKNEWANTDELDGIDDEELLEYIEDARAIHTNLPPLKEAYGQEDWDKHDMYHGRILRLADELSEYDKWSTYLTRVHRWQDLEKVALELQDRIDATKDTNTTNSPLKESELKKVKKQVKLSKPPTKVTKAGGKVPSVNSPTEFPASGFPEYQTKRNSSKQFPITAYDEVWESGDTEKEMDQEADRERREMDQEADRERAKHEREDREYEREQEKQEREHERERKEHERESDNTGYSSFNHVAHGEKLQRDSDRRMRDLDNTLDSDRNDRKRASDRLNKDLKRIHGDFSESILRKFIRKSVKEQLNRKKLQTENSSYGTFYHPVPTKDGLFIKTYMSRTFIRNESVYKIEYLDQDGLNIEFSFITTDPRPATRALQYQEVFLDSACSYNEGFSNKATRIENIAPGKAQKTADGNWKITVKAKVDVV